MALRGLEMQKYQMNDLLGDETMINIEIGRHDYDSPAIPVTASLEKRIALVVVR